ncbi:ABC transporter ATP-binding protein [Propioniciclava sp.]|uniref:ABC transporter ATP-binding protein n=1 Tax=Propioniciclava sp. TaxID=2038686 RepID=UPI00260E383C|nr:ABC transporter ATP-binding protein [Propioniciclava sp.]
MTNTAAITLRGLVKRYGTLVAVDALDLDVPAGQILALLGPNGAGKSTTTEMVLGLVKPDSGSVHVFGQAPSEAVRRGHIGAMLQNGSLLADIPVKALLGMMHGLHAHPLPLGEVIERADLASILRSNVGKLSGGQAQRLRFGLAIMGDPRLLILDEPTVGMDVDARRRFWTTMDDLATGGRTVVFATHYLDEADEFADRIVVMNAGRIVADGTGSQIKAIVGGRHVRFAGPEADWAALPGVVAARPEGGGWLLTCSDSDQTLRALLTNPAVRDVEVTAPRLEDAFLELVA